MIDRMLSSYLANLKKSVLLLGPRQVGKSTLIKNLKPELTLNLANEMTLLEHSTNPELLPNLVERKKPKSIFIDEVQRLPSLLNTVQTIIDDQKTKFYLTGSSSRKLKRGGANLLPGRVVNCSLGPVVLKELEYKMDTGEALKYGFLPEILTLTNEALKKDILTSYVLSYIKEEIRAEALTKSLGAFSRFLQEAIQNVGHFIDYTKISSKSKISRHTCPNYFEILEDTLIGYRVFPPPEFIDAADLVKHPKFYLFDVGVYNGLRRDFTLGKERLGLLSEQLVFSQLIHSAAALRKDMKIHTFRTRGGLEVDFLVRLDHKYHAIEVKHSDGITSDEVSSLSDIKRYVPHCHPLLIHMGKKELKINGIWCLPVNTALLEIGL